MMHETSFPFLPTSTHESDLVPASPDMPPAQRQMCHPFLLLSGGVELLMISSDEILLA